MGWRDSAGGWRRFAAKRGYVDGMKIIDSLAPLCTTVAALFLAVAPLGCLDDASAESDETVGANEAGLEAPAAADLALTDATVVANDLGPDNTQRKHVTNFKWTGGKATVGMGMGRGMYQWIEQSSKAGSLSVVGTDERGARRRVDWQVGRVAELDFTDLTVSSPRTAAAAALTFEGSTYAEAPLGKDPAAVEAAAVGWRVTVPGVAPSRVLALRSTRFHSDDGGASWEGTVEIDIQGSSSVAVSSDVTVDYLDDRGGWLSGVVFSPKQRGTSVAHGSYVTATIAPDRITFVAEPPK